MILRLLFANLLMLSVNYDLLRKDDEIMAKIYFNRMLVGTIIFDAINPKYQNEVKEYGIEYVKAGKLSKEDYEMLYGVLGGK